MHGYGSTCAMWFQPRESSLAVRGVPLALLGQSDLYVNYVLRKENMHAK